MLLHKTIATSHEYAESIINTVREPLNVKPEETVGRLIYDLGNK